MRGGTSAIINLGGTMYDFEYCMKQECKVCSKQVECERGESDGKRTELKTSQKQERSKNKR